jgi:hypothetical protein
MVFFNRVPTMNGNGHVEKPRPRRVNWIAFAVVTRWVVVQWIVLVVTCVASLVTLALQIRAAAR